MRGLAGLAILAALAVCSGARAQNATDETARGEYLFRAADCAACHENPDTRALTGGRAFALPFGVIHATNITPDRETGIGAYDAAAWLRMMRRGIARDGSHLYPVMPYTAYTLLNDRDALAIRAYLMTLAPVRAPRRANTLRFPFNQRWAMIFWNGLYNPDRRMTARADRSTQWNRGAYLAEALAHCAQCHTPRTMLYGLSRHAYAGTIQAGWLAYNLTPDPVHGIGAWTDADLARYLSTGTAPGHGSASGPMAEAVEDGLRYLTTDDIAALVTYLRTLPSRPDGPAAASSAPRDIGARDADGARLFDQACTGCHMADGTGRQSPWAALVGAHSLADPAMTNLRAAMREGTSIETPLGRTGMPPFAGAYTERERDGIALMLHDRWTR